MRNGIPSLIKASLIANLVVAMGGSAQAAGMPQLDVSTFPPQLIWLVLTFAVLYLIMSKVALPRVSQILEERQHRIEDNLNKAEALNQEAQAAAAAYEKSLAEARVEAHSIMVDTINGIAEEAARQQAALGKILDGETRAAEQRINAARDTAMASLGDVAAEVAQATAEKLTGEALDGKEVAAAVAKIMEERR